MAEIYTQARGFNERLIVPRIRESTFGTEAGFGTAADTFYYDVHFEGDAPRIHQEVDTDRDVANGYRLAATEHPRERSLGCSVSLPGSLDALAHFFTLLGGADTVSTPSGGTGNDRVHSIPRSAITTGAHPFSFQTNYDGWTVGNKDIRALGTQINQMRIRGGRTGWLRIEMDWVGPGLTGTPATNAGDTNPLSGGIPGSAIWIPANKVTLGYSQISTEHDGVAVDYTAPTSAGVAANMSGYTKLTAELDDWVLTIDNALDMNLARASGVSAGAGIFGVRAPVGDAENITLQVNVRPSSNTETFHESLLAATSGNNVEWGLRIEGVLDRVINNKVEGFMFTIPIARMLPTPAWNRARGLRTMPITWEAKTDVISSLEPIYLHVSSPRTSAFAATS